jgi:ParB family transcriptional regulator, chromosome partitioning protein
VVRKSRAAAADAQAVEAVAAPQQQESRVEPVDGGILSFELVDPSTLIVGDNVRKTLDLDAEFLEDIRKRGVRVPIVVYPNDAGQYLVHMGQRRTVAAVQVGRATVPAMIVRDPSVDDRIVDQVQENINRARLRAEDEADAYEQLAAIGLTAGQIADRVSRTEERVTAGRSWRGPIRAPAPPSLTSTCRSSRPPSSPK